MYNTIFTSLSSDELKSLIKDSIREEISKVKRKTAKDDVEIINSKDVCQLLNISHATLHAWKKANKIPWHRMGSKIYFIKSEVLETVMNGNSKRRQHGL